MCRCVPWARRRPRAPLYYTPIAFPLHNTQRCILHLVLTLYSPPPLAALPFIPTHTHHVAALPPSTIPPLCPPATPATTTPFALPFYGMTCAFCCLCSLRFGWRSCLLPFVDSRLVDLPYFCIYYPTTVLLYYYYHVALLHLTTFCICWLLFWDSWLVGLPFFGIGFI